MFRVFQISHSGPSLTMPCVGAGGGGWGSNCKRCALAASAQPSAQRLWFDCKQQSWSSGMAGSGMVGPIDVMGPRQGQGDAQDKE